MPAPWLTLAVSPGRAGRGNPYLPFPWIANVNAYGDTGVAGITTSPATFARNSLIIAKNLTTSPATLRTAAPNAIILGYINTTQVSVNNVNTNQSAGTPTGGIVIDPRWWLTAAGSSLTANITSGAGSLTCSEPAASYNSGNSGSPTGVAANDWPATPFPILVSSADRNLAPNYGTHEVMVCTGVSISGGIYTLTVTRDTGAHTFWNSTAAAFSAGARVAALIPVPNFSNPPTFYLNISPFCLRSAAGQRWSDYLATFVQGQLVTFPDFDGPFLDSSNDYLNPKVNAADADMGNQADPYGNYSTNMIGGDGPTPGAMVFNSSGVVINVASGRGVYEGLLSTLRSMKHPASGAAIPVIMSNGSGYPPLTDGMFHENIMTTNWTSPPDWVNQGRFSNGLNIGNQDRNLVPATLFNPCVWTTGASAATGSNTNTYTYNYQTMRIGLAMACLSNSFYQYDWYTSFHGQTWVFDEYYNAQGDSLSQVVLTTDSTITVTNAAKFTAALPFTVRVPHAVLSTNYPSTYTTRTEDETMSVTSIVGNVLHVTRANTVKGTQIVGTAVFTDAQWAAGAGWLGNAKGPAVNNLANLTAISTDDFEAPAASGAVVAGAPTGWVFTGNVGSVTQQGGVFCDGTQFVSGSQCLRVDTWTPTINGGAFTYFNIKLTKTITTTVTSGQAISLSFWAKANRHQLASVRIQNTSAVTLNTQVFFLGPDWQQYWMTFYPSGNDTGFIIQLEFSGRDGTQWIDLLKTYNGDVNIWYRDFDNGLVVLNGSKYNTNDASHGQGATWKLPALTTNLGQAVTGYKRIAGSQDTSANSGASETPGTTPGGQGIPALDALFLLKA